MGGGRGWARRSPGRFASCHPTREAPWAAAVYSTCVGQHWWALALPPQPNARVCGLRLTPFPLVPSPLEDLSAAGACTACSRAYIIHCRQHPQPLQTRVRAWRSVSSGLPHWRRYNRRSRPGGGRQYRAACLPLGRTQKYIHHGSVYGEHAMIG